MKIINNCLKKNRNWAFCGSFALGVQGLKVTGDDLDVICDYKSFKLFTHQFKDRVISTKQTATGKQAFFNFSPTVHLIRDPVKKTKRGKIRLFNPEKIIFIKHEGLNIPLVSFEEEFAAYSFLGNKNKRQKILAFYEQHMRPVEYFVKKNSSDYNYFHVQEVRSIAKKVAIAENANELVVDAAALLHDIGKGFGNDLNHHYIGRKIARRKLFENSFNNEFANRVALCVLQHSGSLEGFQKLAKQRGKPPGFIPKPSTIEAKVLFDSDMLHNLSFFGIAKSLMLSFRAKDRFFDAIRNSSTWVLTEPSVFLTKTGKNLSVPQYRACKQFFDYFLV